MAIDNEDIDGSEACQESNSEAATNSNAYSVDSESNDEVESETRKGSKQVELLDSKIRNELVPVIGMEFETEEQAYEFYKAYAYTVGFNVRRSKFHTDKCGKLRDRIFVCSCEGKREKDKRDASVKCHRAVTRFGCQAKMKISCRTAEKYRVVEFVSEHTHVTISPRKTRFFRSHRIVPLAQIAEPQMADSDIDSSGVAPKARRYRDLCRLLRKLAIRAAQSEETYGIAMSGFTKMLEDVDACLKEQASQEPNQLTEPIGINDSTNKVRGIKTKAKPVGTSKRPENALAKLTQKRKRGNKELHHSNAEYSSGPSTQRFLQQSQPKMDLMPPHMHFSPFQFPQQYYIGTQNPISNIYQQGRSSLVSSLQPQLPSEEGLGLMNSRLSSTTKVD